MIAPHNLALLHNLAPLLAARNNELFRSMGSGFRQKQENFNPIEMLVWLLVIVGGFCALGLLSKLLNRRGKRRLYNSPRALFRALCRRHELDAGGRRLLRNLASHHRLTMPAQIFLLPECFRLEGLSPALQAHASQLANLRQQLFGVEPTASLADVPTSGIQETETLSEEPLSEMEPVCTTASVALHLGNAAIVTLAMAGGHSTPFATHGEGLPCAVPVKS